MDAKTQLLKIYQLHKFKSSELQKMSVLLWGSFAGMKTFLPILKYQIAVSLILIL